jgi:hypothetical protein
MSDYFQDIRKLHPKDHRECLVIARPEAVLKIVKKHQAMATHLEALTHLEQYGEYHHIRISKGKPSEV